MTRTSSARLCVWEGGALWIGRVPRPIGPHAHATIQATVALTGEVRFRTRTAAWTGYRAAIVPADHRHAFDGSAAGLLARMFVDAETPEGVALARAFAATGIQAPPRDRADAAAAALLATWGQTRAPVRLVEAARRALDALGARREPRRAVDPALGRAVELIRSQAMEPLTAAAVAKAVGLPVARLKDGLPEATGLPFKNLLVWIRVARAAALLSAGKPVVQCAREAGFDGKDEMEAAFTRLFGVPTAVVFA